MEPEVKRDVNLRQYNTLGVEAAARCLVTVKEEKDILFLHKNGVLKRGAVQVLGSGSNILFRGHVDPLLLKMEIDGIQIVEDSGRSVKARSGAGIIWHDLVQFAVEHNLGGIENLALIPGTVGAAPVQNIGAYGVELEQVLDSLRVFDLESGSFCTMDREECRFSYRDSIFKRAEQGRYIITSVTLSLSRPPHVINRNYRDLSNWLEQKNISLPGIDDIYRGVVAIRSSKLPDPSAIGNAGSFFKNPIIAAGRLKSLRKQFPDLPSYQSGHDLVKIPAAWLIERAGWKGRRIGDAGTYENQALVIVNHGNATGEEIWALAQRIRESVRDTFRIDLVPEVNIVGSPPEFQNEMEN